MLALNVDQKTTFELLSDKRIGFLILDYQSPYTEVIDGQRCLTTLMLILRAFYNKFAKIRNLVDDFFMAKVENDKRIMYTIGYTKIVRYSSENISTKINHQKG